MDYNDVRVALSEENSSSPSMSGTSGAGCFSMRPRRPCGRDVGEFGDYFRTQR